MERPGFPVLEDQEPIDSGRLNAWSSDGAGGQVHISSRDRIEAHDETFDWEAARRPLELSYERGDTYRALAQRHARDWGAYRLVGGMARRKFAAEEEVVYSEMRVFGVVLRDWRDVLMPALCDNIPPPDTTAEAVREDWRAYHHRPEPAANPLVYCICGKADDPISLVLLVKSPRLWEAYILKARDDGGGSISYLPGLERHNLPAKYRRGVVRALQQVWVLGVVIMSRICLLLKHAWRIGFLALSDVCALLACVFEFLSGIP